MRAYNAHQFVPLKWSGRNWARRMGWSREELDQELAGFYERIFRRYADTHGKHRWGDKTPLHTWHIDAMARLFPDAVFIGTIRHPGGSVGSNMGRFGHSFNRATKHVGKYDREIVRQAARYGDRFALVRYEELVLRPEPVLRELLDWLGEPWCDSVLDHSSVQVGRGGRLTVEGKNRIDDPIDVSRIDKWHRMMPADKRPRAEEAARAAGRVPRLLDGRPGGAGAARARRRPASSAAPTSTPGSTRSRTSTCAPRASRRSPSASTTRARCSSPRWSSPRRSRPPRPPTGLRRAWRRLPLGLRRRVRRLARRV